MQENIQKNTVNENNISEAYRAIVQNIERNQSQAYKGVAKTDIMDVLNDAYISLVKSTVDLSDKSVTECKKLLYHSLNLQRGKYFRKNGNTQAIFQNDLFTVNVSEQESKSILENIASKNDYTAYDCDAVFSYVSEKLKDNSKLNDFFNCFHDSFLEFEKVKDIHSKVRAELEMKPNTVSNRLNSLRSMFANDENIINYFEDAGKEVQSGNASAHQKARYSEYNSLSIEELETLSGKQFNTLEKGQEIYFDGKYISKADFIKLCGSVTVKKETCKAGFKIVVPEKNIGGITAKKETFKPPYHKEGKTMKRFAA